MNKLQVIELLKVIKRTYPHFDVSSESIEHHLRYLQEFPFDTAMDNVDRWIKTERFPPTIADIRGRLGDQFDSQRSKEAAASHIAQIELARKCDVPPPIGYWEQLRAVARGNTI